MRLNWFLQNAIKSPKTFDVDFNVRLFSSGGFVTFYGAVAGEERGMGTEWARRGLTDCSVQHLLHLKYETESVDYRKSCFYCLCTDREVREVCVCVLRELRGKFYVKLSQFQRFRGSSSLVCLLATKHKKTPHTQCGRQYGIGWYNPKAPQPPNMTLTFEWDKCFLGKGI